MPLFQSRILARSQKAEIEEASERIHVAANVLGYVGYCIVIDVYATESWFYRILQNDC